MTGCSTLVDVLPDAASQPRHRIQAASNAQHADLQTHIDWSLNIRPLNRTGSYRPRDLSTWSLPWVVYTAVFGMSMAIMNPSQGSIITSAKPIHLTIHWIGYSGRR